MNERCYKPWHMIATLVVGMAASYLIFVPDEAPTIGANKVPVLHCEEDEVIAFDRDTPVPHSLGCVHPDGLR